MSKNYNDIKIVWISKRGLTALILTATIAFLIFALLPILIIAIPEKSENREFLIEVIVLVSGTHFLFYWSIVLFIKLKRFNKFVKYFYGIWACVFGFGIIGVLLLSEKIIEKEEIVGENPDTFEGYEPNYYFEKIDRSKSYDKKRDGESDELTYWIPLKMQKALKISWYSQIAYIIASVIVCIILISVFFNYIACIIGFTAIIYMAFLSPISMCLIYPARKKGWISRRSKIGIIILAAITLNIVSLCMIASSEMGYNTDLYKKVPIPQFENVSNEGLAKVIHL